MKNIEVGAQLMAVAVAGGLLFASNAHAHPFTSVVAQTTLSADWDETRREEQVAEERQRRYYDDQRAREQYERDQRERARQDEERRRSYEQQQRYYNN